MHGRRAWLLHSITSWSFQWSEAVMHGGPCFSRSWWCAPGPMCRMHPLMLNTIARAHRTEHRTRPCEQLHAVVQGGRPGLACSDDYPDLSKTYSVSKIIKPKPLNLLSRQWPATLLLRLLLLPLRGSRAW